MHMKKIRNFPLYLIHTIGTQIKWNQVMSRVRFFKVFIGEFEGPIH